MLWLVHRHLLRLNLGILDRLLKHVVRVWEDLHGDAKLKFQMLEVELVSGLFCVGN